MYATLSGIRCPPPRLREVRDWQMLRRVPASLANASWLRPSQGTGHLGHPRAPEDPDSQHYTMVLISSVNTQPQSDKYGNLFITSFTYSLRLVRGILTTTSAQAVPLGHLLYNEQSPLL